MCLDGYAICLFGCGVDAVMKQKKEEESMIQANTLYVFGSGTPANLVAKLIPEEEREYVAAVVGTHQDLSGMSADLTTRRRGVDVFKRKNAGDLFVAINSAVEDKDAMTLTSSLCDHIEVKKFVGVFVAPTTMLHDEDGVAERMVPFTLLSNWMSEDGVAQLPTLPAFSKLTGVPAAFFQNFATLDVPSCLVLSFYKEHFAFGSGNNNKSDQTSDTLFPTAKVIEMLGIADHKEVSASVTDIEKELEKLVVDENLSVYA